MTPWHFNILMLKRRKDPEIQICMLSVEYLYTVCLSDWSDINPLHNNVDIVERKTEKSEKKESGNIGREWWGSVPKQTETCYLTCIFHKTVSGGPVLGYWVHPCTLTTEQYLNPSPSHWETMELSTPPPSHQPKHLTSEKVHLDWTESIQQKRVSVRRWSAWASFNLSAHTTGPGHRVREPFSVMEAESDTAYYWGRASVLTTT